MTNEEAISIIKNAFSWYEDNARESEDEDWSGQHEALRIAIQALEQQPSEDCISREAVLEHICEAKECYKEECKGRTLKRCPDLQWVFDLPPVTPKRPKGKWIEVLEHRDEFGSTWHCECSECRARSYKGFEPLERYCPNCGAYMLGYEDASKKFRTEPSEDCISRQAVDDAIYDYSRSCDVNYEQIMEFIDKLPPVTPKYTDEEIDKMQEIEQAYVDKMIELAIEESRQKVKPSDSVNRAAVKLDMLKYGFSSPNITITEFVDSLPPVKPKRPKGKWIVISCEPTVIFKCSECGMRVINPYRYCPNCGAEMSGGEEDETDN